MNNFCHMVHLDYSLEEKLYTDPGSINCTENFVPSFPQSHKLGQDNQLLDVSHVNSLSKKVDFFMWGLNFSTSLTCYSKVACTLRFSIFQDFMPCKMSSYFSWVLLPWVSCFPPYAFWPRLSATLPSPLHTITGSNGYKVDIHTFPMLWHCNHFYIPWNWV